MNRKVKSDFLFAQPSFASGAARVFDLWGQFDDYNRSRHSRRCRRQSDCRRLVCSLDKTFLTPLSTMSPKAKVAWRLRERQAL